MVKQSQCTRNVLAMYFEGTPDRPCRWWLFWVVAIMELRNIPWVMVSEAGAYAAAGGD